MGEKNTEIVFGCFERDLRKLSGKGGARPEGVDKDDWEGWTDWLSDHPSSQRVGPYNELGFAGVQWSSSYESEPSWIGFRIQGLGYPSVMVLDPEKLDPQRKAWEAFRMLLAEVGVEAPPGRILVAHDE